MKAKAGRWALMGWMMVVALRWPSAAEAETMPNVLQLQPQGGFSRDAGLVRVATNGVEWRRGQAGWLPASPGLLLKEGDLLRTAAMSMLVIEMPATAGFVHVLGGSQLAVAELRKLPGSEGPQVATFKLNEGKAYVRLRKFNRRLSRFHVETPGGSTAVRGTEFVVAHAGATTTVGVAEGMVAVSAAGRTVDVKPGQASSFAPGQPPAPPAVVPPVPLQVSAFAIEAGKARLAGTSAPGCNVFVNGQAAAVAADGSFVIEIPLAAEATAVQIETLDSLGRVSVSTLTSPEP